MIEKEFLDRIERLEEKANMKEMEGMEEAFNIFVDSCEKAGVKFGKEEKQVEEWPKVGDVYHFIGTNGKMCSWSMDDTDTTEWRMKNIPLFKTEDLFNKYYSIIDTINEIVDELGRPSWEDFEDINTGLHTIIYDLSLNLFCDHTWTVFFDTLGIFPYCKKDYQGQLFKKVSQEDLLWAFKKSMRLA